MVVSQNRSDFSKLLEKFQARLLMYHEIDLEEKKNGEENGEKGEKGEKDKRRIFDYDKGNYWTYNQIWFYYYDG